MKFWVQHQNEGKHWVDSIGTDDLPGAIESAKYEKRIYGSGRVVERHDAEIWPKRTPSFADALSVLERIVLTFDHNETARAAAIAAARRILTDAGVKL